MIEAQGSVMKQISWRVAQGVKSVQANVSQHGSWFQSCRAMVLASSGSMWTTSGKARVRTLEDAKID
jgi:hypothetical protein